LGLILFSEPPLAFIHIPKSAGTSIGTALARAGKTNGWLPKAHDLHSHAGVADLAGFMGEHWMGGAEIIAVIRNPWDRLVSLYNFRLAVARQRIEKRARGEFVKAGISDEQDRQIVDELQGLGFSRWLRESRLHEERYGVPATRKSQMSWCCDAAGVSRVTRLLKLERLDMEYLRRLGADEIPELNRLRTAGDYRKYYDDEAIGFVGKYFAADIEAGGYEF
jgi:hypothetical protein